MMLAPIKYQRGASFIVLILLLSMISTTLMAAVKMVPVYYQDRIVRKSVEGVLTGQGAQVLTLSEIRARADRSLRLNGVDDFDMNNIRMINQSGVDSISIDYEKRVHLFFNIDAVISFSSRIDR
jgi:hypothetical protein